MQVFPHDIAMIYVSFDLVNVEYQQEFERRWYRNGEHFHSKSTNYDEAWRGYTYLGNPNTHDSGDYVLRIYIEDHLTTAWFKVEEAPFIK